MGGGGSGQWRVGEASGPKNITKRGGQIGGGNSR